MTHLSPEIPGIFSKPIRIQGKIRNEETETTME